MRTFPRICSQGLYALSEHPVGPGLKRNLFFLVTNIEYDIVPGHEAVAPDAYVGASAGELGCWVDCENTRMLLVGNEQCGIPGCWDTGKLYEVLETVTKMF